MNNPYGAPQELPAITYSGLGRAPPVPLPRPTVQPRGPIQKLPPPPPIQRPSDPIVSQYFEIPQNQQPQQRSIQYEQLAPKPRLPEPIARDDKEQQFDLPAQQTLQANFKPIVQPELRAQLNRVACKQDNSSRKLLQVLIVVFSLFALGLLVLYFVFGTKPTANKASKYAYVAVAATFIVATIISAISLSVYARKTCKSCTAT